MKGTIKQIILGQARQSYKLPWGVVPQASSSNVSQAPNNITLDFVPREQLGAECADFTSNKHQTTNQGKSRQVKDQLPEGSPKGQTKSSMATLLAQRPAVKQAGGCGPHSRSRPGHRSGT